MVRGERATIRLCDFERFSSQRNCGGNFAVIRRVQNLPLYIRAAALRWTAKQSSMERDLEKSCEAAVSVFHACKGIFKGALWRSRAEYRGDAVLVSKFARLGDGSVSGCG
jgi:hypothetical protein